MEREYRYIVFVAKEDTGYYTQYYTEKESNTINDIIAIVRTEKQAKAICGNTKDLDYKEIIWEM